MKTYILFVACGNDVENKIVEHDVVVFAKKS